MCGLTALACLNDDLPFAFDNTRIKIFLEMLYGTALRGDDSTGIFNVNDQNIVSVHKRPISAGDFLKDTSLVKFERRTHRTRYLVGHCRWATKGSINYDNSHPFQNGKITLVHNGGMHNTHDFKEVDFDVDSNYISYLLDRDNDVPKTLSSIRGDFALIWYNRDERSFNFVHNEARPLWALWEKNYVTLVSEPELLYWIFKRNKLNDFKIDDIKEVQQNVWYKVTKPDPKEKSHVQRTDIEFKKIHTVHTGGYGHTGYGDYSGAYGGTVTRGSHSPSITVKEAEEKTGIKKGQRIKFFFQELELYSGSERKVVRGKAVGVAKSPHSDDVYECNIHGIHKKFEDFSEEIEAFVYDEISSNEEAYCLEGRVEHVYHSSVDNKIHINIDRYGITAVTKDVGGEWHYSFNPDDGTTIRKFEEFKTTLHLPTKRDVAPEEVKKFAEENDLVRGPKNIYISTPTFNNLVENGCTRCGRDLLPEDAESIEWVCTNGAYFPYCPNCEILGIGALH